VAPPVANSAWSPATFSVNAPDGLRQLSQDSWSIKGGRAFLQVRRKQDDSLELRFVYPFDDLLPDETIALIRTRWSSSQVERLADQLDITPEQIQQLKAVSTATDIPVNPEDRKKLTSLFNDYLSATDKEPAEKALVAGVTAIDQNYYDRTIEKIGAITTQVKKIFQEGQLTALMERFGPRRP
jgi:hypothetical protein